MTVPDHLLDEAAKRLEEAYATRTPCTPVRDLIGETDIASAYAVQNRQTAHRTAAGARIVGRKTGLTNPAVQAQLGVDQPDFGVLFDDMDVTTEPQVPSSRLLQPKAEAEVAFMLKDDLLEGDLDVEQCRAAVDYAMAAIEIVDSRVADWQITIADTAADNASSGLRAGRSPVRLSSRPAGSRCRSDRTARVTQGNGWMCLGDPLVALVAVAASPRLRPAAQPARWCPGALGPMVSAPPGSTSRPPAAAGHRPQVDPGRTHDSRRAEDRSPSWGRSTWAPT